MCAIGLALGSAHDAAAHEISVDPQALSRDAQRLEDTLRFYRDRDAAQDLPQTPAEQRRALGAAEIELGLGHTDRALQILMGRLADPAFRALPEYVDTLLMTSEILEGKAEDVGAMYYARAALERGGDAVQMAEAGARWFRLARRTQRTEDLVEVLNLWRRQGGEKAAGDEIGAQVHYQVAFALRAQGQLGQARQMLAKVPSSSAFGSRAAYLAGVVFTEEGNLAQAERWFSAVMDWPVLANPGTPGHTLEAQVRDLAALSAARLRYEKNDLEAADAAYRRITAASPFQREACWERAYLDLERGQNRGALKRVQCVVDLGARGSRAVDARLFRASLLAHMERYDRSLSAYERLHEDLVQERDLFAEAVSRLGDTPAGFMFDAMERTTGATAGRGSPGPATLFADAWTPAVDQAYRVDRGARQAAEDLGTLMREIKDLATRIQNESAFSGIELKKKSLEVLLKETRHLEGHGRQALQDASHHASAAGAAHAHEQDAAALRAVIQRLQTLGRETEREILDLDRAARAKKQEALQLLTGLLTELEGIEFDLRGLEVEAAPSVNAVARIALSGVQANLSDAAMRAEFGVLDTFWLKKQHRTRAVERLLQQKKETEKQVLDAIEDLSK